jgi:hypothetical protein
MFVSGTYRYADVMDIKQVQELLVNNQIDWMIHLSALLSAVGQLSQQWTHHHRSTLIDR